MNTNLPGNPYEVNPDDFDAASDCRTLDGDYATSDAILKEALVQATLALAYEVRTANLIALLDHAHPNAGIELAALIHSRLGSDQETPND